MLTRRWQAALAAGLALVLGAAAEPTPSTDDQALKEANVGTDDRSLLDFFRRRTLSEGDRARLRALVAHLGDDSFDVREKASAELLATGAIAEPFLRQASRSSDIEVARRAEDCLRRLQRGGDAAVCAAAARVVARKKPAGAAAVLLAYLPFAENEFVAEEVRNALAAVASPGDKADATLRSALADADPFRRASAGEALGRGGPPGERPAVQRLLSDADPSVRLRVAVALAGAGDRDAVPVLIDLLGLLPPDQAWPAEEVLLRVSGDEAPAVSLGTDEATRRQCRDAWAGWWAANQAHADLARAAVRGQPLGYTLLLFLDSGRAMELDAKNRVRWQFDGLQFPLDIQYLPGNRVLVAEYSGNRVTERTVKGDVVWEKKVDMPLAAQRLPNGHTFIATSSQLIEVDAAGKEVSAVTASFNNEIMKAEKLPNGDFGCVMMHIGYVRMDSQGHEINSFPVDVRTSGGKVDVLPDGHVLVPERVKNRVAEYDAQGKLVWEAEVPEPIAAVHLPGGHCLVTTLNPPYQALELDRSGKVVWKYDSESRVNRAFRR